MPRPRLYTSRYLVLPALLSMLLSLTGLACQRDPSGAQPLNIGLIAPLTGYEASSGEAIQRGMLLALDEVNRQGGVLGRPLALVTHDVPNDPALGVAALQQLHQQHGIVAVFSGVFSPVILAQLDAIHRLELPLFIPRGSLTSITNNRHTPNYAFRVAISDEYADEFLARYAVETLGARRLGILADTTAWGAANVAGLTDWTARVGVALAGIERFDQGDGNMNRRLAQLRAAGADALLLVANAPEGAAIVRGLGILGWKVPVVSHNGLGNKRFVELAGVSHAEGVWTLQTFSFAPPQEAQTQAVLQAYHARFGTHRIEEVTGPSTIASGYDALHLLARAIHQAGTAAGPQVREALEHLQPYAGLMKHYAPAFTPERHDALLATDYHMAIWHNGALIPAPQPRLLR